MTRTIWFSNWNSRFSPCYFVFKTETTCARGICQVRQRHGTRVRQQCSYTLPFGFINGIFCDWWRVIPETSRFLLLWNMSTFLKHLSLYFVIAELHVVQSESKKVREAWYKRHTRTGWTLTPSTTLPNTRLRSRLHGSGQIFARIKLAPFYLAFTRHRRNWTNFWTAKCASLGPSFFRSQTCTLGCSKVRQVPPVPCKRKVEPCKFYPCKNFSGLV